MNGVSFSHDGTKLAWVGHDSSVTVASGTSESVMSILRTTYLPFVSVVWISGDTFIAAGHQLTPVLFRVIATSDSLQTKCLGLLVQNEQKKELSGISAMKKFQSLDRHARVVSDMVRNIHSYLKFYSCDEILWCFSDHFFILLFVLFTGYGVEFPSSKYGDRNSNPYRYKRQCCQVFYVFRRWTNHNLGLPNFDSSNEKFDCLSIMKSDC